MGRLLWIVGLVCFGALGCGDDDGSNASSDAASSGSGGAGGGAGGSGAAGGQGGGASVEELLAAQMEEAASKGFSGAVVVVDGAGVLLAQGYGACIRETETPCTADTVFDIGSLTKQFTAAAVMAEVEDGHLALDDTLASFFPAAPADKAAITVHQLLTHTAGLPDVLGGDYEPVDRQAFLDLAFAAPLDAPPGEQHAYSNVGYSILGAILEVSTGASYEAALRAGALTPAGLGRTGYLVPDWASLVVAHGYEGATAFGSPLDQPWADDGPYWHLRANGGLLSTPLDMVAWHEALIGDAVLDVRSKEAMFTPHVEEGPGFGTYYGYGWVVQDTDHGKLVWHNGGNGYFFADLWRYLDAGVTVFVASNAYADYPGNDMLAFRLAKTVLDGG